MPSNRALRQSGFGLVEVLVASALMAVALVVLLGSLSSVLLGSRIAERRTVEQRLARSHIERLLAGACDPAPGTRTVDSVVYTLTTDCRLSAGYMEMTVTVRDSSGNSASLSLDRVQP